MKNYLLLFLILTVKVNMGNSQHLYDVNEEIPILLSIHENDTLYISINHELNKGIYGTETKIMVDSILIEKFLGSATAIEGCINEKQTNNYFYVKNKEVLEIFQIDEQGKIAKLVDSKGVHVSHFNDYFYSLEYDESFSESLTDSSGSEVGVNPGLLITNLIQTDKGGRKDILLDIRKYYGTHYYGEIISYYSLCHSNRILLITGKTEDSADYYDIEYLLIDLSTSQVNKVQPLNHIKYSNFIATDLGRVYSDNKNSQIYFTSKGYVFDSNITSFGQVLAKSRESLIGSSNVVGKSTVFFLGKLEDGTKKIIETPMSFELEQLLYKVFEDIEIEIDYDELSKFELGIIKNMIFAKHNYSFSNPYYQVYFNLFEFYNDEKNRSRRTKDLTGLLTKADKANLDVIKEALKKYE